MLIGGRYLNGYTPYFFEKTFEQLLNEHAISRLGSMNIKLGRASNSPPLFQLLNTLTLAIPQRRRKVIEASSLTIPSHLEVGYQALKNALNNGRDLSPFQGRKNKGRQYGDFVDYLKANYGLDHFHLGDVDERGNVKRTGFIALVYITKINAYVVDITQHDTSLGEPWWTKRYLKLMHSEWPDVIAPWRLENCMLTHDVDEEGIKALSKNGVNTALQLDNKVAYLPLGGGFSSNNTHFRTTHVQISLLRNIQPMHMELVKYLRENNERINDFKLIWMEPNLLIYSHIQLKIDIYVFNYTDRDRPKTKIAYCNSHGYPPTYVVRPGLSLNRITSAVLHLEFMYSL